MNQNPARRLARLAMLALCFSSAARSASPIDLNTTWFRPAAGGDGLAATEGARPPQDGDPRFDLKLWGVGEKDPISVGGAQVFNRFIGWASLQIRIESSFSIYGQLPWVFNQNANVGAGAPFYRTGALPTGAGDAQLGFRFSALRQDKSGLNLAFRGSAGLPSSNDGALAGDARPTFEALAAVSRVFGDEKHSFVEALANLYFRNRRVTGVPVSEQFGANELGGRLGLGYYPGSVGFRRVFAELDASSGLHDFGSGYNTPAVVRGGVTLCLCGSVSLEGIIGKGLTSGTALGAPDLQFIGALGWSPGTCNPSQAAENLARAAAEKAAADKAASDKLAAQKAAADKVIADKAAAEKAAADKIAADKAAVEKAAADKIAAEKAAADKAVADKAAAEKAAADKAAEEAAAARDTDGDGVPDRIDNCPTEKGTKENFGCPAAKKQKVAVRDGKIDILDKVQFAAGKAVILPASFPLLGQVASVLKAHPEIEQVEVQGHTDSAGAPEKNMALSQSRAQAVVDYLAKKGVDKARLAARGYGETTPIADNKTKAGQEKNRRVEFKVLSLKKATAQ